MDLAVPVIGILRGVESDVSLRVLDTSFCAAWSAGAQFIALCPRGIESAAVGARQS